MRKLFLALLILLPSLAAAAPKADLWAFWNDANESSLEVVDHSAWQTLLDKHLDAAHNSGVNRVNYAAFSAADKATLASYIRALESLKPRELNRNAQQAYWLNLYNALTVQRVLADFPVKSILKVGGSFFRPGPWNEKLVTIEGQAVSLNDIEHRILRPIWQDPRIHFAVNCASIGCPNLLSEAFTAQNLETLLEKAARDYLAHPRGLDFGEKSLTLSKIFDWYQVDFGNNESETLKTLSRWLPVGTAERLKAYNGRIKYQYDWALNQP